MIVRPEEVKIEVWPYGESKGGQHVGTNPGVKITHLETGTVAICSLCRSQHKNREIAFEMIEAALTSPYGR